MKTIGQPVRCHNISVGFINWITLGDAIKFGLVGLVVTKSPIYAIAFSFGSLSIDALFLTYGKLNELAE